jgi:hypothetical protein
MEGKAEMRAWRRKWISDEDATAPQVDAATTSSTSFDGALETASSSSSPPTAPPEKRGAPFSVADNDHRKYTNSNEQNSRSEGAAHSQPPSSPRQPSSSSASSPVGSPKVHAAGAGIGGALDHDSDVDDDGEGLLGQSFDDDDDQGLLEDGEEDLGEAGAYGIEEVCELAF